MKRLVAFVVCGLMVGGCGGSEGSSTTGESEDGGDTSTTAAPGERDFVTYALGALIRVNPDDGTSTELATIEGNVTDLAVGGGSVWLARDDGTLLRVSPATGEIQAEIDTGVEEQAIQVAYSDGAVWTLHGVPGIATTMVMIDPAANVAHHVVNVPEGGAFSEIAAGEGGGWAIGGNTEKVTILYRLDPTSGGIEEFDTGVIGTGVATGGGLVWISGFGFPDDREGVEGYGRFDPSSGTTSIFPAGNSAAAIAYTAEALWLSDPLGDGGAFVHRIDPDSGEVQASIPVGDAHSGNMPIYLGAGFVWAHSETFENTVYVIDPTLNEVVGLGVSPGGHALLFP